MNSLTLRINPSGSTKMKNAIGFAPVSFDLCENIGSENKLFNKFLSSKAADEQLDIVKKILDRSKKDCALDVIKFLALVFLHAEVKHPVKCFLVRHVTRSDYLQHAFAEELSGYIKLYATEEHSNYHSYINVVSKIARCIENFPAGAVAFKLIETELAVYFRNCLQCCVDTLWEVKTLSPTEKNEIFNLSHLALRLLLYIIQKVNEESVVYLTPLFVKLRLFIKYLLFDEDTPMDTKTLSGILYLTIEILEYGKDSWVKILDSKATDSYVDSLLVNEAARLSLYSAIVTVVPIDRLQEHTIDDTPALVYLTDHIIANGERTCSESVFTLNVARSIVQLSKALERLPPDLATALSGRLLGFAWPHLDHYMDSVRHLASQALTIVAKCAAALDAKGSPTALLELVAALRALPRGRRSYYVGLCALGGALGARRMRALLPTAVAGAAGALQGCGVRPSATTALEMLLQQYARDSSTEELYSAWVLPVLEHAATTSLESSVLGVLENLLAKAVALDENLISYILPHIKESCDASPRGNLKCALMILHVCRKSGALDALADVDDEWRASISYDVLRMAAVDAFEETRTLALSLAVECRRSTQAFGAAELALVLHYLQYNINAQSPNFRQLTLSLLKKFMKRFEDSYAVVTRQHDPAGDGAAAYYPAFVQQLRTLCFSSLLPGANYSRRLLALHTLRLLRPAMHRTQPQPAMHRDWPHEYVEKLLLHLEDSYESNKALALQILMDCPTELLENKKYRVSLELEAILQQASSVKPAACVSAAYKLVLLLRMRPQHILAHAANCSVQSSRVPFVVVRVLLDRLQAARAACGGRVVAAARRAPMFPLLHCIRHVLLQVEPSSISGDEQWRLLVEETIEACISVSGVVACVVNHAAPEGWLPGADAPLEGVSAQGVLLCAWRCVKEVSLLLGSISSRLSIVGEEAGGAGTLSQQQLGMIGSHLASLLANTKHRGAFEQAYVGYEQLLARLWRCRNGELHAWPRRWLRRLLGHLARPRAEPTRRSGGLPFMIQALVTTELQVQGNPKCLHECMETLLKLARATSLQPYTYEHTEDTHAPYDDIQSSSYFLLGDLRNSTDDTDHSNLQYNKEINDNAITKTETDQNRLTTDLRKENSRDSSSNKDSKFTVINGESSKACKESELTEDSLVESRTHSVNILRALFRNSVLEESMAGYVGEGLMVALAGFEGRTWMERNSSTLLFSALAARVFGARARHRMTGRVFFQRYPRLYDFIKNKLEEAVSSISQQPSPCLYPLLVVLARLHASALDGAQSALRLAALMPAVRECARARAVATRRLAAAAAALLVSPDQYIPHVESMLALISEPTIPTNHCHGILLQLTRLLAARPEDLVVADLANSRMVDRLKGGMWILARTERTPCYMLLDEYVNLINLIIWRFPSFLDDGMLNTIRDYLDRILFAEVTPPVTSGRDVCLANIMYLYIVILNKSNRNEDITQLIYKGFEHMSYEVVLSTLNYILILYNSLEVDSSQESHFETHLATLHNDKLLIDLKENEIYFNKLCNIVKSNKYMECIQKTLRALSLENNTQKYIVEMKLGRKAESDEEIIRTIFNCIRNEHKNLTHIYLESLSKFVTGKLKDSTLNEDLVLEVVRVIFACCFSENGDSTRSVATGFLERNLGTLLESSFGTLAEKHKFELRGSLLCAAAALLEDDHAELRQRTADAVTALTPGTSRVIASRAAEVLRDLVVEGPHPIALLALLALVDFKAEVCLSDERLDECRVFDQNERYNIFLEESVWTSECADKILTLCGQANALPHVLALTDDPTYSATFRALCNHNLILLKQMVSDKSVIYESDVLNPKIELFINKLSAQ